MPNREPERQVHEVDRLRAEGMTQAAACREVGINPASYRKWKSARASAKGAPSPPVQPMIFISHRHEDKVIADAFRDELLNWDFTHAQIFQSSHPKGGPTIGSSIKQEIRKALSKTHLVVLVFTYARHDWQYCMWEVGLATDPVRAKTRIIALQCFDDRPKVFADDLILAINYNDIQRFVRQFHKDGSFFPGLPAYRPNLEAEASRNRSQNLLEALKKAAEEVRIPEQESSSRWGCITLAVGAQPIGEIRTAEERDPSKIREKLESIARMVKADREGIEHLGFDNPKREANKSLKDLANNWRRTVRDEQSDDWVTDLCADLNNAILNRKPNPTWQFFCSAGENAFVFLLVNTVRTLPDGGMEFDIYVYRVPSAST